MNFMKIVSSLLLFVCGCLFGMFFFKDFTTTKTAGDYRNITDVRSSYNADAEVAQAFERMKHSSGLASVIVRSPKHRTNIALTFDGLTDRTTVQRILDLLKQYNVKATFFVDGLRTAEDPQTVVSIRKAGQKIENYTLVGLAKMETLSVDRLVKDFCRAQKIIKVTTDQGPNLLKCNDTKYTTKLLQAAKACGFNSVVRSDMFIDLKLIKSLSAAESIVRQIKPGSIVSVKLKANVEPIVNEPGKTALRPAIDKQPGLKELPPAELSEKEVVDAVEKLLIALKGTKYATTYVENFSSANKADQAVLGTYLTKTTSLLAEQVFNLLGCRPVYASALDSKVSEIKMIATTEPAIAYTFAGLANETVVNDVLARLDKLAIKATFFVLETEIDKYPEIVRKIIDNGHEIGIAIRPRKGETVTAISHSIMHCRKLLHQQFGVATNLVKQPWGEVEDNSRKAVANLGCELIGQSVAVVQSRHKNYASADQVMAEIFGKYVYSLARGKIVHFRMDYYTNNRLVGDLLETIKQCKVDNIAYETSFDNPANNPANDSAFTIKPVGTILYNRNYIYQYPVDPNDVPEHLKISRRGLKVGQSNFAAEVVKRYIGHAQVVYTERLLGFSPTGTSRLDKSGVIHTGDNVIFLTFDDWGTDAALSKILYVLRKHQVPATFFVITKNVMNNPNLLRTIAEQGHEIGSHSDQHQPLWANNKSDYIKDLAESYKKLHNITGDVTVNGKPSLTRLFRSPSLTLSRAGFEAVFATGYQYIIFGAGRIEDHKAQNVVQLVRTIKDCVYTKNGDVNKGTILIMHMGDSCLYTAIALDILLTANAAKPDSDLSKFKVGRLSDYLVDGYPQIKL